MNKLPQIDSIVLLSGPIAVGKTSLRFALTSQYAFEFVRSSDYLKKLAEHCGQGRERTAIQNLGDQLDLDTDYRWLIDDVTIPGIAASPNQKRWLVDSVRKHKQVSHFRHTFGSAVFHVHLNANEDILRARYSKRAEGTPYEVAIEHPNEIESRSLSGVADFVIDTGIVSPHVGAKAILNKARLYTSRTLI